MDVSLRTLKDAFSDPEYQRQMRDFNGFMFILATPADARAFKDLLNGFDDLHYLTGEHLLIVGPSLKVNGRPATRQEITSILIESRDGNGGAFATFRSRQLEESYDFSNYIGLPTSNMPCFAIFDTLNVPKAFVSLRLCLDQNKSLVEEVRGIVDHLSSRCKWRENKELQGIRKDLENDYPKRMQYDQNGVLNSLRRDQELLLHYQTRLGKASAISGQRTFLRAYTISLTALGDTLNHELLPRLSDEKRSRTEYVLSQLSDGHYLPKAIDHLRMIRKTHTRTLSESAMRQFDLFFDASDQLYRCDRLKDSITRLEASIERKAIQLSLEVRQEKQQMRQRLEALDVDISTSSLEPLTALAELPNARFWRITSGNANSGWLLDSAEMQRRRHEAEEILRPMLTEPRYRLADSSRDKLGNVNIVAVILTAVKVELEAVLATLKPLDGEYTPLRIVDYFDNKIYYVGILGHNNVAVTMSRMGSSGRGASLITAYKSIVAWKPRFVLMVGIAFGRNPAKQQLGDVLVSSLLHCYELQRRNSLLVVHRGASPECGEFLRELFENEHGWTFPLPRNATARVLIGPLLSGEKLIDDPEFKNSLFDAYPDSIGGEMEAAGVYAAASTQGLEWIVVKGICDWADGSKSDGYQQIAANAAVSLVTHVLSQSLGPSENDDCDARNK